MARKPLKPCRNQCGGLTRETYCEACCERVGGRDGKRVQRDERPSPSKRGYTKAWERLRERKLRNTPLCQLCAETGRTEPATVVHHLDPVNDGNPTVCRIERLQSVCLSCHSKGEGWGAVMSKKRMQQQIDEGIMIIKRCVVCGPPASGKSTWVNERRKPGDLVWDFDAVATVVTGISGHDRPAELIGLLMTLRTAVVDWIAAHRTLHSSVYVIVMSYDMACEIAAQIGGDVVAMDTDEATCLGRIATDESRRTIARRQRDAVKEWFAAE